MGQDGLNETFSRDLEEIWSHKKTKSEPLTHSRDWTLVDFLLCVTVLCAVIACVISGIFCVFLRLVKEVLEELVMVDMKDAQFVEKV